MKENFQQSEKMKIEAAASMLGKHPHPGDRPAGDGVEARIAAAFSGLTESERRLAEVMLEAGADLSASTAGELAVRAGVSAATAARFVRRLGYESYGDLRRAARAARAAGSPLDALADGTPAAGDFSAHVARDVDNLRRLAADLSPASLDRAVAMLTSARRVFVIGFRNSAALAGYARGLLAHVRDDIRQLPLAGQTLAEDILDLGPGDLLLAFGFRRRPPLLSEAMAAVAEAGAEILLITDASAARTAHLATLTLRCPNRGLSLFDSYVAPMSLISHLCSAVGAAGGAATTARLARIEELHGRLEPFAPPRRR